MSSKVLYKHHPQTSIESCIYRSEFGARLGQIRALSIFSCVIFSSELIFQASASSFVYWGDNDLYHLALLGWVN